MFLYFLKVTICWLVFYLVYSRFLSKETFFKTNRWYLLGTLLLGAGIPLLEFLPIFQVDNPVVVYFQPISEGSYYVQSAVNEAVTNNVLDWNKLFLAIYIIGVVVCSARFFIGLGKIYALYRKSEIIQKENHTLVLTNEPHLPFSFFKYMFWSKDLEMNDVDGQKIVTHEVAHVKGWHSVDVILLEIFSIIFWVSPMVYFYKKSLKTVHEYLADAVVLQTTPTKKYGHLLLRQSQSGLQIALANHFFHSQLKQRIVMMTRSKSRKEAIVKYLFALPVILLLLIAFSKKEAIANMNTTASEITNVQDLDKEKVKSDFEVLAKKYQTTDFGLRENQKEFLLQYTLVTSSLNRQFPNNEYAIDEIGRKVLKGFNFPMLTSYERLIAFKGNEEVKVIDLDEMPRFPGCEEITKKEKRDGCSGAKLLTFIYSNIKYPAEARKAGIQGSVVVKVTVQKDGAIANAKITRDIGGGCGEEALRVINAMPNWIPGTKNGKAIDAERLIPVQFKLSDESKFNTTGSLEELLKEENVVFRIDGSTANLAEVKALMSDDIANIDVHEVTKIKGEEGKEDIITDEKIVIVKTKGYQPQPAKKEERNISYYIDGKQASKKEVDALPLDKIATETKSEVIVTKNGIAKTVDMVKVTTKSRVEDSEPVYKVVEEMPRFKNDDCEKIEVYKEQKKCAETEMLEFIYSNIKYPKAARDAGIQGRVIIKFVVQKDGSITDAKVLRDPGGGCGMEAERVVNMMPNFVPGKQKGKAVNVSYTLPVSFKLAEPDPKADVKIENNTIKLNKDMKPLFIVDGVEFDKSAAGELKPEDIATVNVLKGEKAMEKYGDKGKNGVVEIMLKEGNSKNKDENDIVTLFQYRGFNGGKMDFDGLKIGKDGKEGKPFIILDGKQVDRQVIKDLGPNQIESVYALKPDLAVKKYGKKGKNGAIEVNLKSGKERNQPAKKKTTLNEAGLTYVKIFPNPTDGIINIEYGSQDLPMTISIFGMAGKEYYKKEVEGGSGSLQNIDMSETGARVLFVKFQQDGKTYTEKIILSNSFKFD